MSAYKSDFLRVLPSGASSIRSPSRRRSTRAPPRDDHRLYRLRLHGAVAACRLAPADHDAALDAADRPPADRADGRRHHPGRRSLRQGREPPDPHRRRRSTGNLVGIRAVFDKFLNFEGAGGNAIMANNAEWLNGLNYIDFLRDVGRHFSVNRMLAFDSVKLRLDREQELSFLEFNYMILQAYDFVELHKRTGCILQMGGSDQWGNIVNGIDLGRRMHGAQLFALTTPLLTTSSGAKMGKTAAGAVWLDADLVSPYDYWQYWRNTEDADVDALPEAVHRAAARRDRAACRAARTPKSTRRRRCSRPKRPRWSTAAPPPRKPPTPRAARSRKARSPRRCRRSNSPPHLEPASACWSAFVERGPRRVERRGAPPDQGRRPPGERRDRHRREDDAHGKRPDARRRDQALARQEAPRAAEAGLTAE